MIALIETGGGSSSETDWFNRTYLEIVEMQDGDYWVVVEYKFGWFRWMFTRRDYAEIIVEPPVWDSIFETARVPKRHVKIGNQRPKVIIPRRFFKPHVFDEVEDR